jgi:uncharacterized repeat protein (TIGR01451 family)
MNRRFLLPLLAGLILSLPAQILAAPLTPAGTKISNTASISYEIGTIPLTKDSNPVDIDVGELLDLTLSWQDTPNVLVKPGDAAKMLTFRLTNTGNYEESFLLTLDNGVTVGDNFDPIAPTAIYLDSDGSLDYTVGDTLYDATTNRPTLNADDFINIFVFNAIPDVPGAPADGETAISRLTATAATGSGSPGDDFPNAGGSGTVVAVVGLSGGSATDDGVYEVSLLELEITKSATVTDLFGGSQPLPGSTISYTIGVVITGSGTATNITVTDALPTTVTYTPGTLKLDAALLNSAVDLDAGEIVEPPPGSGIYVVTVRLGDITGAATHAVTFDVTIK